MNFFDLMLFCVTSQLFIRLKNYYGTSSTPYNYIH